MTSNATQALRTIAGTKIERMKELLEESTFDDEFEADDVDDGTIIAMFHFFTEIEMGMRDPETLEREDRFKGEVTTNE